uniref:Prophage PSPPH06, putative reverse transcriptase/maturase n=1 Tax=Nitratidesulfovibrio vulgaris (strain DSM 19637 / Miyazaki F) TaxID=883 RepID=B8DM78_NITV9
MTSFEEFFSPNALTEIYADKIKARSSRGLDRITPFAFDKNSNQFITLISNKALKNTYKFTPYLERLKLKGRDSFPRVISVPTIRDKLTLTALNKYLQTIFPEHVNRRVPNQRIRDLHNLLSTIDTSSVYIARADISDFFGKIDRSLLLSKIQHHVDVRALSLIEKTLQNPTVPYNYQRMEISKYVNTQGIPQGLPLSSILAEFYISTIDSELRPLTLLYDRYVDDIIAISNKNDTFEKSITHALDTLGLTLNIRKTKFKIIDATFNYLGYSFNNANVSMKNSNFNRQIKIINNLFTEYKSDIHRAAQAGDTAKQKQILNNFIESLNIRIAGAIHNSRRYGCPFYYSEITDISQLYQIDAYVTKMLQKHPTIPTIRIKSAARAYYKIKSGEADKYSHNYDHLTPPEKRAYLEKRGVIATDAALTPFEIEHKYYRYITRRLKGLEEDLGIAYS